VHLSVLLIGIVGGVLSGMLGVGGAVILLPLLTTFAGLSLKEASNITVVQVVASSLIGWWSFRRGKLVHTQLALWMGGAGAFGGFAGGYSSAFFTNRDLEWVFLAVVLAALILLFLPVRELTIAGDEMPSFSRPYAAGLGLFVGILAGMLGAGGGFLIVPLMIAALRVPTKVAIGSSAIVKLISSLFAYGGKVMGMYIDPVLVLTLLVGAIPFTYLGTRIARRVSPRTLRTVLSSMLFLIALRTIQTLFFAG